MASEASPKLTPHEPRIRTVDLPGIGGKIGSAPEDFQVDEIAAFEADGSGDHWFVRLKKRLLTTQEMLHLVARAARTSERDIGTAGLKDKHAVTTQWISVPASALPPESWELPEGLEIVEAARHTRKLRTGQQRGNHFRIRLIEAGPDALPMARRILAMVAERGLPNYFGPQRFGYQGRNLERALDWLKRGAPIAGKNARFLRKLYPSVLQSEIFNRVLSARLSELGETPLLEGDVVRLEGTNSLFVVEDPARELPRLLARDIHVTGPMIGPKMKPSAGRPRELEARAVAELGLTERELELLGALAPGTRRDLLVHPADLGVERLEDGSLMLGFSLPSGSYATQLVRELTRGAFESERGFGD